MISPDELALLRAITTQPDDDLPRLVYADWLEERDQELRAKFVRTQVEIAHHQPWDSVPLQARYHDPNSYSGRPWWSTHGSVTNTWDYAQWPSLPFDRGMRYRLDVRQVASFLDHADELFRYSPIGDLGLPTATLADWLRFIEQPWLRNLETIRFISIETPVEPIRQFCRFPERLLKLKRLTFHQASRPSVPWILHDLLSTPLGEQLDEIQLESMPDDPREVIEAVTTNTRRLRRLYLNGLHWNRAVARQLSGLSGIWDNLQVLELDHLLLSTSPEACQTIFGTLFPSLRSLKLGDSEELLVFLAYEAGYPWLGQLRELTLTIFPEERYWSALIRLLVQMPRLQHLCLDYQGGAVLPKVSERLWSVLSDHPELLALDLSGCTRIPDKWASFRPGPKFLALRLNGKLREQPGPVELQPMICYCESSERYLA